MQISLKQIAAINHVSFSNAVDAESKFQKKTYWNYQRPLTNWKSSRSRPFVKDGTPVRP